ncbi:hypothetical protein RchiOBHm_Chr0c16g0499721 [Rosa chinensis]|uniref:Uncharacterized protein n=1 Tax=Rosa chinensis TaxID=74649 RepID=A0A2P6SQH1_ROSCH|nr:hypothetical protein RchiOBHm_Chr0c22g0500471 [Rosa chinensis]PRQ60992.1 hypothetical protein RchiOBHm_Chr0c16g0499721 [Rosa chinensis]
MSMSRKIRGPNHFSNLWLGHLFRTWLVTIPISIAVLASLGTLILGLFAFWCN